MAIAVALIMILTMGVGACMGNRNTNEPGNTGIVNEPDSPENIGEPDGGAEMSPKERRGLNDRMMEYINGRYDDTFTFYRITNEGSVSREIRVRSERFPDELVTVRYGTYETKGPAVGSNTIPADATFDEYVTYRASKISFSAVVAPGFDISNKEAIEQKVTEAFRARRMVVLSARVYFAQETETYEALDKNTFWLYEGKKSDPDQKLDIFGLSVDSAELEWR